MNRRNRRLAHSLLMLFCLLLAAWYSQPVHAQGRTLSRSGKEVYRGNIFYIGGPRGSSADFFTLTVESYTPDRDVQKMLSALQSGGQDDLRKLLSDQKRGTIQIGTRLSRDVQAIWKVQTEEGRKIYALSERWMGFGELRRGARSVDYPFTYVELYVDEDGKAEGELFPAARVRAKKGLTIEIENFGIYPARVTNIKQTRK